MAYQLRERKLKLPKRKWWKNNKIEKQGSIDNTTLESLINEKLKYIPGLVKRSVNWVLGLKSKDKLVQTSQISWVKSFIFFWISVSSSLKWRSAIRCSLVFPALKFYSCYLIQKKTDNLSPVSLPKGCLLLPTTTFPWLFLTKQKLIQFSRYFSSTN